jgi:hypothetical protein
MKHLSCYRRLCGEHPYSPAASISGNGNFELSLFLAALRLPQSKERLREITRNAGSCRLIPPILCDQSANLDCPLGWLRVTANGHFNHLTGIVQTLAYLTLTLPPLLWAGSSSALVHALPQPLAVVVQGP